MENEFEIEYPYKSNEPIIIKGNNFESKLEKFNKNNLIIISDFDYTLSRRFYFNKKTNKKEHLLSGFGFYDLCPDLPENFRKETMDLKLKYLNMKMIYLFLLKKEMNILNIYSLRILIK